MTKEANGILFTAFPSIGSNEADMVSTYDGVILSWFIARSVNLKCAGSLALSTGFHHFVVEKEKNYMLHMYSYRFV